MHYLNLRHSTRRLSSTKTIFDMYCDPLAIQIPKTIWDYGTYPWEITQHYFADEV